MWVIGKITKRTVSAFSIIPTVINIKEDGVRIKDMGKALFG
jgi:hypothetical protein